MAGIFLGTLFFSLMIPALHAVTSRKDALIAFIKDCETESGFTNIPGGKNPTLEATFQALYILHIYGELEDLDEESLIDFVNESRNADHGFGANTTLPSEIYSTYYALWIAKLFDVQLDNHTDEWIAVRYNQSGGFNDKNNTVVTLSATYFGLEGLYFNSTNLRNYNCTSWLLKRQNTDNSSEDYGGFATDGNSSNLWATWAAMGSLSRLNVSSGFLKIPLILWINRSQNLNSLEDDYGGFASKPEEADYSLLNTYAAIYSIRKLGTSYLSQINRVAARTWLLALQNDDGGFRVNSIDAASSLSATYYAFCTLDLLGERDRLLENAPWEPAFELPLWLWFLIGVAIAITAIFIIKKYYFD